MNKEPGSASSIPTGASEGIKAFSLKFLADGQVTIRDEQVGETFHPVIGAMNEARQLYVGQTFLNHCWDDPSILHKTVWDVGLGAAANAVAVYESWARGRFGDLYLESFDQNWEALSFALLHKDEYPQSLAYLKDWDWEKLKKEKGLEIKKGDRSFLWRFHEGDFRAICKKDALRLPDLIMYDLYSAPKGPGLYALGHWQTLRQRLEGRPAMLVLHTRSTCIRVTLALAGWYIGVGTCLGDKEETTLAANGPGLLQEPLGPEWIEKVGRSTSACPILDETMKIGPISKDWLEQLKNHPQWNQDRAPTDDEAY